MTSPSFESVLPNILPLRMPQPMQALLGWVLGFGEIARVYDGLRAMGQQRSIATRLLEFLAVTYTTSENDLAHIPRSGPAIVTANHPFGILEGAILASLLAEVRGDVRFLANGVLATVPEIREMVIPLDLASGRKAIWSNGDALRRAVRHLRAGGLLVVFPAGVVSYFRWRERAVSDPEWNPVVARLVEIAAREGCRACAVPAYVHGRNGLLFQVAGMAHPALRTVLLARELLNKRGSRIEVRVGAPIAGERLLAIPTVRERIDYLRWRTYLLASREQFKARTEMPGPRGSVGRHDPAASCQQIAAECAADIVAAEVAALPNDCRLGRSGELEVYIARANEIPMALRELGRLREITFRAAGEGTGCAHDLDGFDSHYLHLFVWDSGKRRLVGAYRLACTDAVRTQFGVRGLYTATLFQYGDGFLDRLGPALELGRSFVRQEYQRGFAPLLLLWKGIGAFVARNPQYKTLFGPVSISNQYQAASRELMVSFLEKYVLLRDWQGLVRHRHAVGERRLKRGNRPSLPEAGFDVEDLSAVVGDLEQKQTGVPVLLRQYLRLGGKLLGFSLDPKFANALDGLILVDLTKTEPKLLERYLGKGEVAAFLEFQKGT